VDSSLITCTLLYRRIEELIPDSDITYYIDPSDLLLENLRSCDLIVIDELLSHYRGTEVIGHLYDYITENTSDSCPIDCRFPKVIFCSSLSEEQLTARLIEEKIIDKIPSYEILHKPISPGDLEDALYNLWDTDKIESTENQYLENIKSPSPFALFVVGVTEVLKSVFTFNIPKSLHRSF
jgi:hypothetical protein